MGNENVAINICIYVHKVYLIQHTHRSTRSTPITVTYTNRTKTTPGPHTARCWWRWHRHRHRQEKRNEGKGGEVDEFVNKEQRDIDGIDGSWWREKYFALICCVGLLCVENKYKTTVIRIHNGTTNDHLYLIIISNDEESRQRIRQGAFVYGVARAKQENCSSYPEKSPHAKSTPNCKSSCERCQGHGWECGRHGNAFRSGFPPIQGSLITACDSHEYKYQHEHDIARSSEF